MNGAQSAGEDDVEARLPAKKRAMPDIPLKTVVELFRKHLDRGPIPTEAQCYHLRNLIHIVRAAKPTAVLNDDPLFRRRRATIKAMEELIRERKAHDPFPGLRFPAQVEAEETLETLERALKRAEPALMIGPTRWQESEKAPLGTSPRALLPSV